MTWMTGRRAGAVLRGVGVFVSLMMIGCAVSGPPVGSDEPTVAVDQNDPDDHVLAAGDPKITVIEYVDLECPICGRFARDIFPTIREEYVDSGKVRWVIRHFPLSRRHPQAELAGQAAECAADQAMFWEYIDRLFDNQLFLEQSDLIDHAVTLGLDADEFEQCLDSGDKAERVQRDVDSGWDNGINGTPGFIIDGQAVVGLIEIDDFRMRLDHLLAEESQPVE